MRFQNGSNKVVIEHRTVQFWSKIILVISNRTRFARSFDFEITRMISDQIALLSVQLPLFMFSYNRKAQNNNSGTPAARRAARRSPISFPYMGNKRKPMSWFSHGYQGKRYCSWALTHDDDYGVAQHGGYTPNNRLTERYVAFVYYVLLWYWTSMLWSTDTCQNKVSVDKYHVTISQA